MFFVHRILEDTIRIFSKTQNSYLKAIKFNQIKLVTIVYKEIKIQRCHSGPIIHSTNDYQVFITCQVLSKEQGIQHGIKLVIAWTRMQRRKTIEWEGREGILLK